MWRGAGGGGVAISANRIARVLGVLSHLLMGEGMR